MKTRRKKEVGDDLTHMLVEIIHYLNYVRDVISGVLVSLSHIHSSLYFISLV